MIQKSEGGISSNVWAWKIKLIAQGYVLNILLSIFNFME